MVKYIFKFRREPSFFKYFRMGNDNYVKPNDIFNEIKIGGFKAGNLFASFWFGAFLFGMQSYFLRQNLKTDTQFISD